MSEFKLLLGPGDLVFHADFGQGQREYVRIKPDGTVKIAEGVELDEAARAFWEAVERVRK